MKKAFQNFIENYFKIFFVITLMAFVLMIFLMNVPRLFAAGKETIGQKTFQAHSPSHPEGPSSPEITIPTKFYQWRFTKPTAASPEDGYFELQGSKMALTLHF